LPAGLDPKETLARLISLHRQHNYTELSQLVLSEHRRGVIDLLLALDDFAAANRRLCDYLREDVDLDLAQAVDQAYLLDDLTPYVGPRLAIFSGQVELLDQRTAGDEATVSFSAGQRVPASSVRLQRIDGRWQYDPGGVSDHLAPAFRDMAGGLDLVLAELRTGRLSDAELRAGPDLLVQRVMAGLRRGVSLLSKAQVTTDAAGKPDTQPTCLSPSGE